MQGCTVRVFRQDFALEAAIGSCACSLEAHMRVANGIPLGFTPLTGSHCKSLPNTEGTSLCLQTKSCNTMRLQRQAVETELVVEVVAL
jgi:hypothetical protein